jgi:hypothetical protein
VDAMLLEAEHILTDYVSLRLKGNLAASGQSISR